MGEEEEETMRKKAEEEEEKARKKANEEEEERKKDQEKCKKEERKGKDAEEAGANSTCVVSGLNEWLKDLKLASYMEAAKDWCSSMGAADLDEVKESWEDFADGLTLKPLERKRLQKHCEAKVLSDGKVTN